MGDYFLYNLANETIGKNGAKIAVGYSLLNRRINEMGLNTVTNGVEA